MYAADAFSKRNDVSQIVLVIGQDDKEMFNEKFAGNAAMLGVQPVVGGEQRADSVLNGLKTLNADITHVAIHDAARPCIADEWIDAVFSAAITHGAALLGLPCSSTLKRTTDGRLVSDTVPRDGVWLAQTPQVFRKDLLLECYANHPSPSTATDESSIVEASGAPVALVEGSPMNIKVTTKADLRFAELALKSLPKANPFPFG